MFAPDGEPWNVSIPLERLIIIQHQPEWNRRGKTKPRAALPPRLITGLPKDRIMRQDQLIAGAGQRLPESEFAEALADGINGAVVDVGVAIVRLDPIDCP